MIRKGSGFSIRFSRVWPLAAGNASAARRARRLVRGRARLLLSPDFVDETNFGCGFSTGFDHHGVLEGTGSSDCILSRGGHAGRGGDVAVTGDSFEGSR